MKASTQYNDYKGTAAADVSDYLFIRDYLKDRGVDIERYEPVGFELYTGYSNFVSYRFICKDNYSDENRLVKIGFESKDNISDFLDLFKRFNVVLTWNKSDINYADWENPAVQSRACYEVARKHGKPVVIMEPVKGGMLATPPESVVEILKETEPDSSPASWAIRFAADLEGVITVLSGMSNTEQMKDNLSYMREFSKLTSVQKETIEKAQEALAKMPLIPCTSCNYCAKVCPQNIGISGSFTAMNYLTLYGSKERAKGQEGWLVGRHGKAQADKCMKCGKCEQVCPQHIAIRENLDLVCRELLQ